eukprot:767304-Hanusia_phi.AAC.5
MSKFSIDSKKVTARSWTCADLGCSAAIKEWFNPQMKVDPRRIPAVPPPPLISQSQTQAVEVQEEIPEPYTAQPPLYVESHARQEPAPEMMIYQHPVQPPPMMMVDTHTQYLDQAPGGYVQVMQQPQQHFSIAPVQYMYQPEVVTQQAAELSAHPICFATISCIVANSSSNHFSTLCGDHDNVSFLVFANVCDKDIVSPEVQANFVGNTQVQALANDDGTDV